MSSANVIDITPGIRNKFAAYIKYKRGLSILPQGRVVLIIWELVASWYFTKNGRFCKYDLIRVQKFSCICFCILCSILTFHTFSNACVMSRKAAEQYLFLSKLPWILLPFRCRSSVLTCYRCRPNWRGGIELFSSRICVNFAN